MRLSSIMICYIDVPFNAGLTLCTYYIVFIYDCLFIKHILLYTIFGHKCLFKYKKNVKKKTNIPVRYFIFFFTNCSASISY
jgi:positive regulator of sigma E activity